MKDIPVTFRQFGGKRIGKVTKLEETDKGIEVEMEIDIDSLTEAERNWIFGSVSGLSIHSNEEE